MCNCGNNCQCSAKDKEWFRDKLAELQAKFADCDFRNHRCNLVDCYDCKRYSVRLSIKTDSKIITWKDFD